MNLTRLFERHAWWLGLPITAGAAALTGAVVAASAGADLDAGADRVIPRATAAPLPSERPRPSADAILSRNPFDHTSVPLTPRLACSVRVRRALTSPSRLSLAERVEGCISRVGPRELHIHHDAVDEILEAQAELMHGARVVPEQKDGRVIGVRLFGVRPGSVAALLGLESGDTLLSINGYDMADPNRVLEAHARPSHTETFTLEISRRGRPTRMRYVIV
jgi:membrane-associated protease RseP (regulator of RpoE activity)